MKIKSGIPFVSKYVKTNVFDIGNILDCKSQYISQYKINKIYCQCGFPDNKQIDGAFSVSVRYYIENKIIPHRVISIEAHNSNEQHDIIKAVGSYKNSIIWEDMNGFSKCILNYWMKLGILDLNYTFTKNNISLIVIDSKSKK